MSDFPPLQGAPRDLLEAFLESYRRGILGVLGSLTDAQAGTRVLPGTDMTAAGIVTHLARVEDLWFSERFAGRPVGEPWASAPWSEDRDWDFHDVAAVLSFGVGPVSLGWVLVHMLEETAHHAGHLDLLRDALVGRP